MGNNVEETAPEFHGCAVHQYYQHFTVKLMHTNYKILRLLKAAPACFGSHKNHHQVATSSAYLKLHIWYKCTNIEVVSVMATYSTITLKTSITTRTLLPDM